MRNLRVSLAALLVVGSTPFATATAQSGSRAARLGRVDSIITQYLKDSLVPSVAVAVVKGRDTLLLRGYGLAERGTRRAAGPGTVYEIGSITKQFTAAAIMRLVEQGKVALEEPITRYVPSFPMHGQLITVHQLLNHTSGIHNYTAVPAWGSHWAEDLTPDSIVGFVKPMALDFTPGTRNLYSNSGYVLLGMIIERASGKPYAQFLNEQFLTPLDLTQTRYCPSHPKDTSFAAGYTIKDSAVAPAVYLSMTHPFSAGSICSTVRDLVTWQAALHGGRVVTPGSYVRMTTPDVLPDGTALHYGFGLGIEKVNGHRAIWHGGGINGFSTTAMYLPDDTLHVVVFTNTDSRGNPELLAGTIARAVLGLPLMGRLFDK